MRQGTKPQKDTDSMKHKPSYRKSAAKARDAVDRIQFTAPERLATAHSLAAEAHESARQFCKGRNWDFHYKRQLFHEAQFEKHWPASQLAAELGKAKA